MFVCAQSCAYHTHIWKLEHSVWCCPLPSTLPETGLPAFPLVCQVH